MRRWLAIFLLVLLPAQMGWAAVAAYCGHAQGAGSEHVGHHDHGAHGHASTTAQAAADDASGAGTDGPYAADADCGHCHGQCAGALLPVPTAALGRLAGRLMVPLAAPRADHTAAQPERPQWAALA